MATDSNSSPVVLLGTGEHPWPCPAPGRESPSAGHAPLRPLHQDYVPDLPTAASGLPGGLASGQPGQEEQPGVPH